METGQRGLRMSRMVEGLCEIISVVVTVPLIDGQPNLTLLRFLGQS